MTIRTRAIVWKGMLASLIAVLVGSVSKAKFRRTASLLIVLIGFSISVIPVLYIPLSYVSPSFVESWLLSDSGLYLRPLTDLPRWVFNALLIVVGVVVGPVAEEIIFRGFMVPRWSRKWGTMAGVLSSSIGGSDGKTGVRDFPTADSHGPRPFTRCLRADCGRVPLEASRSQLCFDDDQ